MYLRTMVVPILLAFSMAPALSAGGSAKSEGELAVITNWGSDTCSVVDIAGGKELATIDVGLKPYDVKVEPSGRFAYVSASGADYLSVIDLQAMLEMTDRRIHVGESPRDLDITSDGKRAVVATSGNDSIAVVDLEKRSTLYTIKVGAIPYGVAIVPDGSLAVVTNWGENTVSIVELGANSGKVLETLSVGSLPYTAIVLPDGRTALVSSFGSHKVYVIDIAERKVTGEVGVGRSPWGLAASRKNQALVANFYTADASLLGVAPDPVGAGAPEIREIRRIALNDPVAAGDERVMGRAKNVAFASDSLALVSDLGRNRILVLDPEEAVVRRTIDVGKAPYGIAIIPRRHTE